MSSLKIWQRVPDGSTLELRTSADGDYVVGARCVLDTGSEEQWPQPQLDPGPKKKKLKSPREYVVRVRVAFVKPTKVTGTISARIVKPDGGQHGNVYTYTCSGKQGETCRSTIVARTVK